MTTTTSLRWTSADIEALPDDGKRYEVIDGELYVSKQPHCYHQLSCSNANTLLGVWSRTAGLGLVMTAPGLIFDDDDDVAPDLVWISNTRMSAALEPDGKLHMAPELVIEVLSPGHSNERRDREAKRKLYSRRGVQEYWIIDWRSRQIQVYRRDNAQLTLNATMLEPDSLSTPLLPGFSCFVRDLFEGIPLIEST